MSSGFGTQSVSDPAIPYMGPISGGLKEGMSVVVKGVAPLNMTRFAINLRCAESDSSDIALHFNPRFDGKDKVVFNAFKGGSWGSEEFYQMPLTKGEAFEFVIKATSEAYKIKVDGKDFYTFHHRIPLDRVCAIEIKGDVSVQTIHFMGGHTSGGHGSNDGQVTNPKIPYMGPIYGGLKDGMSVNIQGTAHEDMDSFMINLRSAESESSDIALHFNPRFTGWDKVVFNSFENDSWGSEEKIRSMPFTKGQPFKIVFMVTTEGYQVKVDGQDFYTFSHRIPLERVCAIHIAGQVSIQSIKVLGGATTGQQTNTNDQKVFNPAIPYSTLIPGQMSPGRTFTFRGNALNDADSFAINFMESKSNNIALHINPRVKDKIVVRNTKIGGIWDKEERELIFNPFGPGLFFDMSVTCDNDKFKVSVDGQHLFDYHHKLKPVNIIDKLEIVGDVEFSYISF
ncbi:galectin-4-like [Takifugu rubripes]|uniref:galectin-4-like n=1 Tax=Takifugu rubripes TaxID=31033 RepID=UPI0005D1B4B7|nr:galectin-4-like [Takifugu rubripes]|eukprot:XP_011606963.1 PREDICTED: galectin-4-like [Takifugu rubripes]